MDSSELKIELFRKIDSLSSERLKKVYGKILNFLNSQDDTEEWDALTGSEQQALLDGIHQLEQGKVVPHEQVIREAREKYQKNEEES
ncbi:MAG TPA: hypothetical protein PKI34_06075 [Bacteroidales bacterium]|nr:hypothetical protein [Bacteroidales bacterium]